MRKIGGAIRTVQKFTLVSQKMKKQETKIFRNESNNKYGKQQ